MVQRHPEMESVGVYSPGEGAKFLPGVVEEIKGDELSEDWELKNSRYLGTVDGMFPSPRSSEAAYSFDSFGEEVNLVYSVRPQAFSETPEGKFSLPLEYALANTSGMVRDIDCIYVKVGLGLLGGSEPAFEELDTALNEFLGDLPDSSVRVDNDLDKFDSYEELRSGVLERIDDSLEDEAAMFLDIAGGEETMERLYRSFAFDFDYNDWLKVQRG